MYLFDNSRDRGQDKGEIYSVLCFHNLNTLMQSVPIPTETAVLSCIKKACQLAEKNNNQMNLLQQSQSPYGDKRGGGGGGDESGCVYSPYPVREANMLFGHASTRNNNNNNNKKDSHTGSNLDKRVQLSYLHRHASLTFLRQHGLNGSEKVVLKKKNKEYINQVYQQYHYEGDTGNDNEENTTIISTECSKKDDKDDISHDGTISELVQIFALLYYRILTSSNSSQCNQRTRKTLTVLFLHEDYPQELPVFGYHTPNNADMEVEVTEEHEVVCILGAVRDARSDEILSAVVAAQEYYKYTHNITQGSDPEHRPCQVHIKGCHLGYTAEFTSKICAALIGHKYCTPLETCISQLPHIDRNTLKGVHDKYRVGEWFEMKKDTVGESQGAMGHSSHTNHQISTSTTMTPPTPIVAKIPLYCVLSVPYAYNELSASLIDRSKWHFLIQTVVCTLWRSRIISNDNDNDNDDATTVHPSLVISFNCGHVFTIGQKELLSYMASKHQAAPTEYQVLSALMVLFQSKTQSSHSSGVYDGNELVLWHLQALYKRNERPIVLDIMDIQPIGPSTADEFVLTGVSTLALAPLIYAHSCECYHQCSDTCNHSTSRLPPLIVLLNAPSSLSQCCNALPVTIFASKQNEGAMGRFSPGLAITMLQHWAYHGRLQAVMRDLIRQQDGDILASNTSTGEECGVREKREKKQKKRYNKEKKAKKAKKERKEKDSKKRKRSSSV